MDSIENLIKGLRVEISSRLSNRFLSSFYIAAILINWEMWVIIFGSDLHTQAKIVLILSKINTYKLIWFPLLVSIVFSIISPITMYFSNLIWSFARFKINHVYRKYDSRSYLTVDKSLKIKQEMHDYDKKYLELFKERKEVQEEYRTQLQNSEEILKRANESISELQLRESKLREENNRLKIEINKVSEKLAGATSKAKLSIQEKHILSILSKKSPETDTILARSLGITEEQTKYFLDRLSEHNFVVGIGNDHYSLNSEGRRYYFEKVENINKEYDLDPNNPSYQSENKIQMPEKTDNKH